MTETLSENPKESRGPRRTFCVYFYGDELDRVQAAAKEAGMSATKYVRGIMLEQEAVSK